MSFSHVHLLNSYRQLWTNRALPTNDDAYTTLVDAIHVDLKDELSHPRVRVTPQEKFRLAVRRVIGSTLSDSEKLAIIELYESELNKLI